MRDATPHVVAHALLQAGLTASVMCLVRFASSMAIIEVATELELTTEFNTGIEVYQEWQDWMADMVLTAPDGLVGAGMVLDGALRCCSGWWLP